MTAVPVGYARFVLGTREPVLEQILGRSLLTAGMPPIMVDDNAARVLQLLTKLHRPDRVIEVGTLFGYSTIHIARGLPPGGRVTTLEIDRAAAELARENFELAGVSDRIEIIVADAVEYLRAAERQSIGMLFIDADKKSYPSYLKHGYPLLEPGGLLIADDAFALGDFRAESGPDGNEDREVRGILSYARAAGHSPHLFSAFIGTDAGLLISYKEQGID